jgi:hypothetical protein
MPVAAHADITLSGSVSAEYELGSKLIPTLESELSADTSEVLANGMAATASFGVLGDKAQGTIGLEGDFGKVMAGTAAKTLSELADSDTTDATKQNDEDADLNGISYAGSIAGLTVNAATGQFDEDARSNVQKDIDYTTYGAEYDFNGLKLAGQNTKESDAVTGAVGIDQTELTAEYAFGDLTLSGSKVSKKDAVVEAAYEQIMGDLAVKASTNSDKEWDLEATYTMGDLAVTATDDNEAGGAKISAKFTSGDLSIEVDSDSKVTVGYDLGNADLSMIREDEGTKVKYTVSF